MNIPEFPLQWPDHIERRRRARETGAFRTSLAGALENVRDSLRRFATDSGKKIEHVAITSNVTLGNSKPADPGVAVWFVWDDMTVCIPVDRYAKVEANLQAIHHILEARRTEIRHGTLALVRASFRGFQSLPAPGKTSKRAWRTVLEIEREANITSTDINHAYHRLAKSRHPDAPGGSHDLMTELNSARQQALTEIGAR